MRHIRVTAAIVCIAGTLAGTLYVTGPAQAEMASGAALANTCFSCHGTDGRSAGDMPTIAGKSENFITEKLQAFKSDSLDATIMNRIAKGFSDQEIAALAKFFSGK